MTDDPGDAGTGATPEEEQEHDARIGAKMHLFLERMLRAAVEEESIGEERAIDILICTAVQLYAERSLADAQDIGLLCRSIAEEVLKVTGDGDTVH